MSIRIVTDCGTPIFQRYLLLTFVGFCPCWQNYHFKDDKILEIFCRQLTETETFFPDTNLTLIYKSESDGLNSENIVTLIDGCQCTRYGKSYYSRQIKIYKSDSTFQSVVLPPNSIRYALIKSFISPSSTACTLEVS